MGHTQHHEQKGKSPTWQRTLRTSRSVGETGPSPDPISTPPGSGAQQKRPLSLLIFNSVWRVIRRQKEAKVSGLERKKERCLSVADVIPYIENSEESIEKISELINESGEVAGYETKSRSPSCF